MQNRLSSFAPVLLRIGMSLVFFWFSYAQLTNGQMWTSYVPDYAVSLSHMSASTLVFANGIFELVFGALLLLGLFTRIAALLLALHMVEIVYSVGYSPIGVRDFGLCIAAFSIFLYGSDKWCLDSVFKKKAEVGQSV